MKQKAVFLKHKMKTRLLFLMLSFLSLTVSGQSDLYLYSQEEIDSFQLTTSKYWDIIIKGQDITDLRPLLGITDCRNITIENTSLETLSGLDSLSRAYRTWSSGNSQWRNGHVKIIDNPLLKNLSGLENLKTTVHITIYNNSLLENTSELNIEDYQDDYFDFDFMNDPKGNFYRFGPSIIVSNNDLLKRVDGFENLRDVQDLLIENNPFLEDISGFENLNKVASTQGAVAYREAFIKIINNDKLKSLSSFESLDFRYGFLEVRNNDELEEIAIQNDLSASEIIIENNISLRSLGGFNVSFGANSAYVNYDYYVFSIVNNASLESITLGEFDLTNDVNFNISDNSLLKICNVDYICDSFMDEGHTYLISNNSEGCQSKKVVEMQCNVTGLDESTVTNNISIFPNPASDLINIESNIPLDNFGISLKTINGQTLQKLNKGTSSIDVSTYPSGVYLISIESDEMSMVKKVVIN